MPWRKRSLFVASTLLLCASAQARVSENEVAALAATAGAVERIGTRLVIHLRSGKTKELADGPDCYDERIKANTCFGYEFQRYDRARGVFVVMQYYYEGADYVIVDDRTGQHSLLNADPIFSPMGDVAIELVYGESHYYPGNPRMSAWRRSPSGKFEREWTTPIAEGDEYFSVLGWSSNDGIDIERIEPESWNSDGGARKFSIARDGKTWRVVDK